MYVRVSRVVCLDEGILVACEVVEFVRVEVVEANWVRGCGGSASGLWCVRVVYDVVGM
jgi:hypothetical protein